jgi:hypothetical protein
MNPRSPSGLAARGSTLLITNAAKIAGIVVFVNEAVLRSGARDSVIAVCALFVLGAQVAENTILTVIDRVFERPDTHGRGENGSGS